MKILFENSRMIAVDKPAGVLVIPDQYTEAAETLSGKVSAYLGGKAWIVHRIDRDTTGVVLFAKDAEAHRALCRQFEAGTVRKRYAALVIGRVPENEGTIDTPISIEGRKVSIDPRGKPSVTRYKVLERFRDYTLLEVEPQTGRRHQIRIHLSHKGHPLAVDPEYGGSAALLLSGIKRNYKGGGKEKPLMDRVSLHAGSISVTDPESGGELRIESPLPDDFTVALKQLRRHNPSGETYGQ